MDTERYVIAFSFLFQTEKAALHNLECSQREDADSTNFTAQKKDFWWSEAVLARYVAHQGGHNAFSSELGLERALVSNALLEHGLTPEEQDEQDAIADSIIDEILREEDDQ